MNESDYIYEARVISGMYDKFTPGMYAGQMMVRARPSNIKIMLEAIPESDFAKVVSVIMQVDVEADNIVFQMNDKYLSGYDLAPFAKENVRFCQEYLASHFSDSQSFKRE